MNQNNTQVNQRTSKAHWMNLHTFYSNKATMNVTLVDSDGGLQFKIAPVIPGMEGRPQAGVAKYDYKSEVAITLTLSEISAIVTAYEQGYAISTPITFFHNKQTGAITGGLMSYQGRYMFNISDKGKNLNHNFMFNQHKFGQQGQEVVVDTEVNFFITILKSVLSNVVTIKAKMLPEYVRSNTGGSPAYDNKPKQQYQQAPIQQQAPVAPAYQAPMPQQPIPQNNFQAGGLPQSPNTQAPAQQPQTPQGMPSVNFGVDF